MTRIGGESSLKAEIGGQEQVHKVAMLLQT